MNDQVKGVLENTKKFWSNTPKMVKRLLIGGLILLVIGALVTAIVLNTKDYVPLFDGLTETETTEIMGALQEMQADVRLKNGVITVPKQDESRIRMELATAGFPKNGLSYYVVKENSSMLSTDYERKQYETMQLQERIGASIRTLDGVSDAVVTISIPTQNVFYLQDEESTTASVIIHMKTGSTLSEEQVLGIQNLVAKSVAGLNKENIALTDGEGNDLIGSISSMGGGSSKIKMTREIEKDLKQKVNNVLDGPYKPSEYKISVTATLNTDAVKRETTVYTPSPTGGNAGVINQDSSTMSISGDGQNADGGVAGTTPNTDVTTYANNALENGGVVTDVTNDTTYSVNQDTTQTEKLDPAINTVSVGISLDDPTLDAIERGNLIQLVSFAIGIPPESVTIRNFTFTNELENIDTENENIFAQLTMNQILIFSAIALGVLLLLFLLFFFVRRSRKKKHKSGFEESFDIDQKVAMDELFGEDDGDQKRETVEKLPTIESIEPVKDDKKEKIKEFATSNPEIAAQLFKSWLKNEGE